MPAFAGAARADRPVGRRPGGNGAPGAVLDQVGHTGHGEIKKPRIRHEYTTCEDCGGTFPVWTRCKRRTCPSYGPLWAADWRFVLLDNLTVYGGEGLMVTITPPGVEWLPWDTKSCTHGPGSKCSGLHGCRACPAALEWWNGSYGARYSRLHRTAQEATRREVGRSANLLALAHEAQRRGAIHGHGVYGLATADEKRAFKAYVRHLERLAPSLAFGTVKVGFGKTRKPLKARAAAAYLSSYFALGKGTKPALTEAVSNPDLPRRPLYVSSRLTLSTRCTMRNLRRVRYRYVHTRSCRREPDGWSLAESVEIALLGVLKRDPCTRVVQLARPPNELTWMLAA